MNQREAVAIVAVFQAAWGHVEVNERTMAVWHDVLREVPALEGETVAKALVRESAHFPSPSAFYAAWKARRRHDAERARFADRSLPSGAVETTPEAGLAHLAELRRMLAQGPPA